MPFIPEGISIIFKNLKALKVYNSNLMPINAKDLQQFPKLVLLDLYWSGTLETLKSDLFSFTPHLQHVDLGRNMIKYIGQGLLTNLNNLTYFDVVRNACIDKVAPTHAKVLEMKPQLPILCPLAKSSDCDEEIEILRSENKQQSEEIRKLQEALAKAVQTLMDSNAFFEKNILKLEKQITGNSAAIRANFVIAIICLIFVLRQNIF